MRKKILPVIFLLIAGWFLGYMHHYMATKGITESRQELKIKHNIANEEIRRYAGLVNYQRDIILMRSSEMADLILLEGDKNLEFHQLCKAIRRTRPRNNKPKGREG